MVASFKRKCSVWQENEKQERRSTNVFSKNPNRKSNRVIIPKRLIQLVSSSVGIKKKKANERKEFYHKIYENMIRSIQEFEDDNISEWYDCLHNYFRNHEDIIS